MKRRPLRKNPELTKRTRSNREQLLVEQGLQPGVQQNHVLTWDGITAAMTFSIPFVVVVAINLQVGLALTLALAAVLLPISLLAFAMREKLSMPPWIVAPICALVSAGITAFFAMAIRSLLPQLSDTMGMYLYLLAAYPVVASVFGGKKAGRITTTLAWALRSILYFGLLACLSGGIRELLAYNRIFGLELNLQMKLEAVKLPFAGFIMLAFILAGVGAVHLAVKGRQLVEQETEDEELGSIGADQPGEEGASL